jgi:Tol biopolymer transport system component
LAGNARLAWFVAAGLAAALGFAIWARGLVDVASGSKPPTLSRATRVTNTPAEEFGPAISPDNKWVAYYSTARGPTDIWVRFLDSGATLNLTESTTLSLPVRTGLGGLAISPDGTKLAFYARPDASETTYDTWVIPVPIGGSPHRLIQGMQGLQWSPDGSQITCILPGSSRGDALVLASSDGSNPKIIVPAEAGRHIHWPAWSHDGRHIYFISTLQPWNSEPAEIFRVTAGGGAPEAIVRTARRAVYPVPMAGGDLIYAANPDHADLGLWWRPASGGVGKPLTTGVGEHTEARLSADGSKLVSTFVELRQALVSFPASTSGSTAAAPMRAITDGYSGDLDPDIDPHGERLVFSSSRSGDRNLWTAKLDGTDARPLTSGTFIDERPAFSPDGSQIAFVSDRGGQRGIWLVSAGGGVPKRLAPVDVLDGLTWSRDGARVFVAQPDRGLPALAAVSVADGRIERFPTPAAAVVPAASPTADAIAYLEPTTVAGREALSVPATSYALKFVDLAGHPLHTDLPAQRLGNGFLVWAPDGRRLVEVSVTANTPASVWIIEPDSRTPFRKLLDLPGAVRPRGVTWTHDGSSLIIASQQSVSDIVLYDVGR